MADLRWPTIPASLDLYKGRIAILRPKKVDRQGNRGEWDSSTRKLKVAAGLSDGEAWLVFIHELVHAALDDWEMVNVFRVSAKLEEAVCSAVSLCFHFILRKYLEAQQEIA